MTNVATYQNIYPQINVYMPAATETAPPPSYGNLTQERHNAMLGMFFRALNSGSIIAGQEVPPPPSYEETVRPAPVNTAQGAGFWSWMNAPATPQATTVNRSAPLINIDNSDRSTNILSSRTTTNVKVEGNGNAEEEEKKAKDDTMVRLLVGVISTVILGGAFYVMGAAFGNYETTSAKTELNGQKPGDFAETSWQREQRYYTQFPEALAAGETFVNVSKRIDDRRDSEFYQKITLLAGTILAASLALFGYAVMGSQTVMIGGFCLGVVVGLVALAKLGYSWNYNPMELDIIALNNAYRSFARLGAPA